MEKAIVILSGGMDSTTLLYDVLSKKDKEVHAVCFNYGQKHSKELNCARETCMKLDVPLHEIRIEALGQIAPSSLTHKDMKVPEGNYDETNMKSTVVPNRNMVLISLATSLAIGLEAKTLYYGAHKGDHTIYPDCRREFVEALRETIKLCDWNVVNLQAPYIEMDKGDIAIRGKELGVNYKSTWTCYKGLTKACGKCGSCRERLEAFEKAGMEDPIQYEVLK